MVIKKFFVLVFLCFSINNLFCQLGDGSLVRKMVSFIDFSDLEFSSDEKQLLYNGFFEKIKSIKINFNIIDCLDSELKTLEQQIQYTENYHADSFIVIKAKGTKNEVFVEYFFYDLLTKKIVKESNFSNNISGNIKSFLGGFWMPLIDDLKIGLVYFGQTVLLTINANPNTVVYGLPEGVITIPKSGSYNAEVVAYSGLDLTASLQNFHDVKQSVIIGEDNKTIYFEQEKKYNLDVDISFVNLSFPRLALGYEFVPEIAFVKLATEIYLLGILPFDYYRIDGKFVQPSDLWTINLELGGIINIPHVSLKIPIYLGAALRMLCSKEVVLDKIFPVNLYLASGLDFKVHKNVSIFVDGRMGFLFNDSIYSSFIEDYISVLTVQASDNLSIDFSAVLGIKVLF